GRRQTVRPRGVDLEPHDAGELAPEAAEPALKPVAAVLRDGRRDYAHEAGLITSDQGKNESGRHAATLYPPRTTRNSNLPARRPWATFAPKVSPSRRA